MNKIRNQGRVQIMNKLASLIAAAAITLTTTAALAAPSKHVPRQVGSLVLAQDEDTLRKNCNATGNRYRHVEKGCRIENYATLPWHYDAKTSPWFGTYDLDTDEPVYVFSSWSSDMCESLVNWAFDNWGNPNRSEAKEWAWHLTDGMILVGRDEKLCKLMIVVNNR